MVLKRNSGEIDTSVRYDTPQITLFTGDANLANLVLKCLEGTGISLKVDTLESERLDPSFVSHAGRYDRGFEQLRRYILDQRGRDMSQPVRVLAQGTPTEFTETAYLNTEVLEVSPDKSPEDITYETPYLPAEKSV